MRRRATDVEGNVLIAGVTATGPLPWLANGDGHGEAEGADREPEFSTCWYLRFRYEDDPYE